MNFTIHWFRRDLRLKDNPALVAAAREGKVLLLYICDGEEMGAASRVWLHHSLSALNKEVGGKLAVYRGEPVEVFGKLVERLPIKSVYWNRCYELHKRESDKKVEKFLQSKNIKAESFNGSLLWEPDEIHKADGTPYKVFTPFYRKGCLQAAPPRKPLPAPKVEFEDAPDDALKIEALQLLPKVRWDKKIMSHWQVGEAAAEKQLTKFIAEGLSNYKDGRDLPAAPFVSRLSPHLHFGEVSPNRVWYAAQTSGDEQSADKFCSELGWREFSHSLLYYNPDLPTKNLQKKFDKFEWRDDEKLLRAWQRGETGVPIVDAGMRELWQTGYMHNRVRMITASYLVKNLLQDWRHGAQWFWDCLVDADLANNSASWQWVAGCGADAAPYFRIFNPITQAKKFDPDGNYIRAFVPELDDLYPEPIVDLKESRELALATFRKLKA